MTVTHDNNTPRRRGSVLLRGHRFIRQLILGGDANDGTGRSSLLRTALETLCADTAGRPIFDCYCLAFRFL